jgi:Spy/CpxP family protein refolding chaperone
MPFICSSTALPAKAGSKPILPAAAAAVVAAAVAAAAAVGSDPELQLQRQGQQLICGQRSVAAEFKDVKSNWLMAE